MTEDDEHIALAVDRLQNLDRSKSIPIGDYIRKLEAEGHDFTEARLWLSRAKHRCAGNA